MPFFICELIFKALGSSDTVRSGAVFVPLILPGVFVFNGVVKFQVVTLIYSNLLKVIKLFFFIFMVLTKGLTVFQINKFY